MAEWVTEWEGEFGMESEKKEKEKMAEVAGST